MKTCGMCRLEFLSEEIGLSGFCLRCLDIRYRYLKARAEERRRRRKGKHAR